MNKTGLCTVDEVIYQFEQIKQDAITLYRELDPDSFLLRPEPGKWSVGDHISHLNISGSIYVDIIDSALERSSKIKLTGGTGYKPRLHAKMFINVLEPPIRIRLKSPKKFKPVNNLKLDPVFHKFAALQEVFQSQARNAAELDMSRILTTTAVSDFRVFNLFETLMILCAHQRRHLWRVKQILYELPEKAYDHEKAGDNSQPDPA